MGGARDLGGGRYPPGHPYLGRITWSITWMTPLSATMSAWMTLAPST